MRLFTNFKFKIHFARTNSKGRTAVQISEPSKRDGSTKITVGKWMQMGQHAFRPIGSLKGHTNNHFFDKKSFDLKSDKSECNSQISSVKKVGRHV
jgi:hypothetical protein